MAFHHLTTYRLMRLTGTGYDHPRTSSDNEFQQGFNFDWTTGLPYISGSTVKGILRSVFPGKDNKSKNDKSDIIKGKIEYLLQKLNIVDEKNEKNKDEIIKQLENEIFVKNGDLFYDAYISDADKNDKIFEDDYITHHSHPLKNPIPIRILKIRSGVTFKFQFRLVDSNVIGKKITAEEKKNLFQEILSDFGIGAKRNTGYGYLL